MSQGRLFKGIDRVGVAAVDLVISSELHWIFREQPVSDFGIDAHVEVCEDAGTPLHGLVPTGRLLGLQIKAGKSYFSEPTQNGWVYRGDRAHASYWLNHTLPVVLVLYDPDARRGWWTHISRETMTETEAGWKTVVPASHEIGSGMRTPWGQIANRPRESEELRRLASPRTTHWIATFGVNTDDLVENFQLPLDKIPTEGHSWYVSICDWLTPRLLRQLNETAHAPVSMTESDDRSGETLSVRVEFEWDPSVSEFQLHPTDGWWELLELLPYRDVYDGDG